MPMTVGRNTAVHGRHTASSGAVGQSACARCAHTSHRIAASHRFTSGIVPPHAAREQGTRTIPFGHIAHAHALVSERWVATKRSSRPTGPHDAALRGVAGDRKYVAVLSDHALCRRAMADLLLRRGTHVLDCATFAQLSGVARSHRPIAVIVDLDHAEHDTWTLVREIRQLLPEARIIPLGTTLRQAAAIESPDDAGIETARADSAAFTRLTAPR